MTRLKIGATSSRDFGLKRAWPGVQLFSKWFFSKIYDTFWKANDWCSNSNPRFMGHHFGQRMMVISIKQWVNLWTLLVSMWQLALSASMNSDMCTIQNSNIPSLHKEYSNDLLSGHTKSGSFLHQRMGLHWDSQDDPFRCPGVGSRERRGFVGWGCWTKKWLFGAWNDIFSRKKEGVSSWKIGELPKMTVASNQCQEDAFALDYGLQRS